MSESAQASAWERLMSATPAIDEISRQISVTDLIALTRTSSATRAAFYSPYRMRVDLRLKLSRNFKDPDLLLAIMRRYKIVVGGKRAVSMIWEDVMDEDSITWELCVLMKHYDALRFHLEHYQELVCFMEQEKGKIRDARFEWAVFKGRNVVLTVNILASENKHPIPQFFGKFCLTVLNCFSSVDATFIGYPEFTLNKIMAKRISTKRGYNEHSRLIDGHHEVQDFLDRGWLLIPTRTLKELTNGPPNVGSQRHAFAKNSCNSPIRIIHKPYLRLHQQTEKELGTIARIREEKYRYVDILPPVWIDRTWVKMRPTFKIDPTSLGAKAKGQGMLSWMEKVNKVRTDKIHHSSEIAANFLEEYSLEYSREWFAELRGE